VRVGVAAVQRDVHFVEQGAQQLRAVLVGGGRLPHLAEVVAEGQDRGPLAIGEGRRAGGLAASQISPGVRVLTQGVFPFGFHAAGDEPVVRVDGPVAASCFGGIVAGLFHPAAVLGQGGIAVFELPGGSQAGLVGGGCQGGEEGLPAGAHVPGAAGR